MVGCDWKDDEDDGLASLAVEIDCGCSVMGVNGAVEECVECGLVRAVLYCEAEASSTVIVEGGRKVGGSGE